MSAQMAKKIVYWRNPINQQLTMGLPENYPAPWGWEKIVCGTAMAAEFWSNEMRKQERIAEEAKDEERERIEGPMKKQLRSHMFNLMANARNEMNREFLRRHLELYDKRQDKTKFKRESYLHSEAYEHGR
jgi:aspartate oxidase